MTLFGKRSQYSTVRVRKRDMPDGLWVKCPGCSEILYRQELDEALGVCRKCGHHFPLGRAERIAQLAEAGAFEEWDAGLRSMDPLGFTGTASYTSKLESHARRCGYPDAIACGRARIGPHAVGLGVMDFRFLGASMGSVVGEKVARLIERSTAERMPVVMCCASGGARMYEGMFSLMQMAKTSGAVARHGDAGLPYLTVLTDPTTAGVMASFASLGDVILAEPGALIGFAGPRVIRETTQQELPQGFQRSEFLLEHGLIDCVVPRSRLKATLVELLTCLVPDNPARAGAAPAAG